MPELSKAQITDEFAGFGFHCAIWSLMKSTITASFHYGKCGSHQTGGEQLIKPMTWCIETLPLTQVSPYCDQHPAWCTWCSSRKRCHDGHCLLDEIFPIISPQITWSAVSVALPSDEISTPVVPLVPQVRLKAANISDEKHSSAPSFDLTATVLSFYSLLLPTVCWSVYQSDIKQTLLVLHFTMASNRAHLLLSNIEWYSKKLGMTQNLS